MFTRKFYARQDEIIDQYSDLHERHTSGRSHDEHLERNKRWTLILIKTTLLLLLFTIDIEPMITFVRMSI
jgi:hypothetical protein